MHDVTSSPGSETPLRHAGAMWLWFVILGIVLLVAGVVALGNLFAATLVSIFFIGAVMLIGGISQMIHALKVKGWARSSFWLLSGLLYSLGGAIALVNPVLASATLTLLFGIMLIAAGIFRIWVALAAAAGEGRLWIAIGGIVTILAGLVVALGWPVSGLWVFGLLLAIDLSFQGCMAILFGLLLKPRG